MPIDPTCICCMSVMQSWTSLWTWLVAKGQQRQEWYTGSRFSCGRSWCMQECSALAVVWQRLFWNSCTWWVAIVEISTNDTISNQICDIIRQRLSYMAKCMVQDSDVKVAGFANFHNVIVHSEPLEKNDTQALDSHRQFICWPWQHWWQWSDQWTACDNGTWQHPNLMGWVPAHC